MESNKIGFRYIFIFIFIKVTNHGERQSLRGTLLVMVDIKGWIFLGVSDGLEIRVWDLAWVGGTVGDGWERWGTMGDDVERLGSMGWDLGWGLGLTLFEAPLVNPSSSTARRLATSSSSIVIKLLSTGPNSSMYMA